MIQENLKRLRTENALTTRELSKLSKVSIVTINKIEKGYVHPLPKTIKKLAKFFKISPKELMGD